jgi:hypothetical protein
MYCCPVHYYKGDEDGSVVLTTLNISTTYIESLLFILTDFQRPFRVYSV